MVDMVVVYPSADIMAHRIATGPVFILHLTDTTDTIAQDIMDTPDIMVIPDTMLLESG